MTLNKLEENFFWLIVKLLNCVQSFHFFHQKAFRNHSEFSFKFSTCPDHKKCFFRLSESYLKKNERFSCLTKLLPVKIGWILSNVWKIWNCPSWRIFFMPKNCFPKILVLIKSVNMKLRKKKTKKTCSQFCQTVSHKIGFKTLGLYRDHLPA